MRRTDPNSNAVSAPGTIQKDRYGEEGGGETTRGLKEPIDEGTGIQLRTDDNIELNGGQGAPKIEEESPKIELKAH